MELNELTHEGKRYIHIRDWATKHGASYEYLRRRLRQSKYEGKIIELKGGRYIVDEPLE